MEVGYRAWFHHLTPDGRPYISSVSADYIWRNNTVSTDPPKLGFKQSDVNLAIGGVVPDLGFFSYKSLDTLLTDEEGDLAKAKVIGVVLPFGKRISHEFGYRSEHCQILGFANHMTCSWGWCESPADTVHYTPGRGGHNLLCVCYAHSMEEGMVVNTTQMSAPEYLKNLSDRYGCDLMSLSEMKGLQNGNR